MSTPTKAALMLRINELEHEVVLVTEQRDEQQRMCGQLQSELNAMHVAQRPSRRSNATPEQARAHSAYREALSAARELAITTGKSVLVTTRG